MNDELTQAIDLAIQNQWEEAHELVAESEHPIACWLHAVLHKIEGDISNSNYWYRRAKRSDPGVGTEAELLLIKEALQE